ncbi:MAG: hypothetical protein K2G75_06435, partial [Muribaculaceae bacterium]|nr:hypothetical protein [Muribaculaceae bacterium]
MASIVQPGGAGVTCMACGMDLDEDLDENFDEDYRDSVDFDRYCGNGRARHDWCGIICTNGIKVLTLSRKTAGTAAPSATLSGELHHLGNSVG